MLISICVYIYNKDDVFRGLLVYLYGVSLGVVPMYVCVYIDIHIYMYVFVHIYKHAHLFFVGSCSISLRHFPWVGLTHVCIYKCMYMHMYILVYIYTNDF